jgi:hypothetical protein
MAISIELHIFPPVLLHTTLHPLITVLDPKDPDGDSTMTSSIDSIRPDDSARTGARTPTGNAQASSSGLNTSELSPPGSQTQQCPGAPPVDTRTALEIRAGQTADKNAELAAWKTKRAQEDYQRAMEYVVDKDFTLSMWCIISTSPVLG